MEEKRHIQKRTILLFTTSPWCVQIYAKKETPRLAFSDRFDSVKQKSKNTVVNRATGWRKICKDNESAKKALCQMPSARCKTSYRPVSHLATHPSHLGSARLDYPGPTRSQPGCRPVGACVACCGPGRAASSPSPGPRAPQCWATTRRSRSCGRACPGEAAEHHCNHITVYT